MRFAFCLNVFFRAERPTEHSLAPTFKALSASGASRVPQEVRHLFRVPFDGTRPERAVSKRRLVRGRRRVILITGLVELMHAAGHPNRPAFKLHARLVRPDGRDSAGLMHVVAMIHSPSASGGLVGLGVLSNTTLQPYYG